MKKIAVVGLGQIGGSFVLALRKRKVPVHLTGIDPSRKRIKLLKHALDAASTNWERARKYDLVILCVHFDMLLEFLEKAPKDLLLLDVCSGKNQIVQAANRLQLRFIGGHPMAGNEREEEKGWDPDLFTDRPFFICRTAKSTPSDFLTVERLAKKLGAFPLEVRPEDHDRFVAMTSHFPAFLSELFANISAKAPSIYRGPGYQSMTRLGRTPSKLLETFLHSNRENILETALQMREALDRWIRAQRKS